MKEAMFYEKLEGGDVRCGLCNHFCRIKPKKRGICGVRENEDGTLVTLVYGKLIAMHVDPIEKKPLFHFIPGHLSYSIATVGCNFRCLHCQNADISQMPRERGIIAGEEVKPERVVAEALAAGCQSVAFTYTEPTIFFEYAYDTARLAHREGILNTFVTNGYITPEAVKTINGYLDAATVDFKGSGNPEFYRHFCGTIDVGPIYEALLSMKEQGIFIEITNLIVPGAGDSADAFSKLVRWVIENLGDEVPFHILRFFSSYRYTGPDDLSMGRLVELWKQARGAGMRHVYLGNVLDGRYSNTICPQCGKVVIDRVGMGVSSMHLNGNRCEFCGKRLNLVV